MLRKHEALWWGQIRENFAWIRIDLVPDAKHFQSPAYRACPKTRELERADIDKQLKGDMIEPAMSESAAPVLFVPYKDGKLPFSVDYRKYLYLKKVVQHPENSIFQ